VASNGLQEPVIVRKVITQWIKDQFTGYSGEERGNRTIITFSVDLHRKVVFEIEDVGFCMHCFGGSLKEYFSFEGQDIVGGKWNANERVSLADPDFNAKLAAMLCRAVMVISIPVAVSILEKIASMVDLDSLGVHYY